MIKRIALILWKFLLWSYCIIFASRPSKKLFCKPRIFYGGARSGNLGGPLVKLLKLKEFFPQRFGNFNLVYVLSNAIYLPKRSIDMIGARSLPIVLNQNGVYFPAWYSGDHIHANSLMSFAYHKADYVFWQSKFCKRAADKFLGSRVGSGEVLYNAVDITKFYPSSRQIPNKFIFLMTGKINRASIYRLETAVKGLVYARRSGLDAKIIFAGWVEDVKLLRLIIAKYEMSQFVHFSGPYTQSQAPNLYRQAHAYLSTTYMDNCPSAVIEALASGLPVLYLDSGGTPELVGSSAGVGIPVPEDWDRINFPSDVTIGLAMIKIAERVKVMGEEARNRAEIHFNIDDWVLRHHEIFRLLMQKKGIS